MRKVALALGAVGIVLGSTVAVAAALAVAGGALWVLVTHPGHVYLVVVGGGAAVVLALWTYSVYQWLAVRWGMKTPTAREQSRAEMLDELRALRAQIERKRRA